MDWVTVLASAATPALALLTFLRGGLGHQKKVRLLERHLELLVKVAQADGADARPLVSLVNKEIATVAADGQRIASRKVNSGTLAALVVVAVVTALVTLGLWQLDNPIARAGAVLVAMSGSLLVAAGGIPQLFEPEAVGEARRQARQDSRARKRN